VMQEIPKDLAEWKNQQGNMAIFRQKGGEPESEACRLLEIGPTNRTVTAEEARRLFLMNSQSLALGPEYRWLARLADMVEEYQLTIGNPKNARETFAAVLTQSLRAENQEKLGFFDRLMGKKSGTE